MEATPNLPHYKEVDGKLGHHMLLKIVIANHKGDIRLWRIRVKERVRGEEIDYVFFYDQSIHYSKPKGSEERDRGCVKKNVS
ncbi:unnamed protein product [Lupinus luteus]|uniref:Uncharacterized protein n=1 Tax=Lupinus luteus TaxID=3873 RepID=A0AAV1WYQ6_LUPLU